MNSLPQPLGAPPARGRKSRFLCIVALVLFSLPFVYVEFLLCPLYTLKSATPNTTPRQADREVQEFREKIRQRRQQQQQQQQRHERESAQNPSPAEIAIGGPVAAVPGERAAADWPGSKGSGGAGGGSVSELSEPSTGTRGDLEVGGGQSR